MNRIDVLDALAPLRGNAAVVMGPGIGSFALAERCDHPMTIYNFEMASVTGAAVGVALGWPAVKVIAIEGDGSILMGQCSLTTVARYKPENMIILVFDNGRYITTGSGTAKSATTTGTSIELIGKGAGISKSRTVTEVGEMKAALHLAFKEPGPWLIVAKIDASDRDTMANLNSLPVDCYEAGQRFRQAALAMGAPYAETLSGVR
jgi:sulfopyruvate decarboxylase subunit beta